jgi:hypothetical protein
MSSNSPLLELKPATLFTPKALAIISLYGLILMIPVLVSMMLVSVLRFGVLTFVVPLATIVVATYFLPLGFGNPYVARLVRPLQRSLPQIHETYVVQLTQNPRNRTGLWAILEDADDLGVVTFTELALVFHGDSILLTVPFERIKELRLQSASWRALFAYGPRISFSVDGLSEAGTFTFAERSSCILPTSRKNARRMYQNLGEKIRYKPAQGQNQ